MIKNRSAKLNYQATNVINYIVLTVMSIAWLIPIVWMLMQSLSNDGGSYSSHFFPHTYTFNNFKNLFTDTRFEFLRWFQNTIIVAIFTCLVSTVLVLMVSYALSRLRFKMRKAIMKIALVMGMFPGFMSMIAIYYFFKYVGLGQTLAALVLAYSGAAGMGFYIVKGFFDTIPMAVDEAALIDGATRHQVFLKITLPLSKPIIVYTILMSFLAPWFDFIFVSYIMRDAYKNYNVAYGLYKMLQGKDFTDYYHQFFAGATLVALIITTLFMVLQKYYVAGITGGTVKG